MRRFEWHQIRNDVGAFTTSAVLGKWNDTPSVVGVYVKMTLEPCKSSSVAYQVEKRPSSSPTLTKARRPSPTTKVMQRAMKWKAVQVVQAKNGYSYPVHRTSFRTELGVFDDHASRELPAGNSVTPEFVKAVAHDWILNCLLPPALRNEALEQLKKTNCPFGYAAFIDHCYRAPVFFNDQNVVICGKLHGYEWLRRVGSSGSSP